MLVKLKQHKGFVIRLIVLPVLTFVIVFMVVESPNYLLCGEDGRLMRYIPSPSKDDIIVGCVYPASGPYTTFKLRHIDMRSRWGLEFPQYEFWVEDWPVTGSQGTAYLRWIARDYLQKFYAGDIRFHATQ